MISYNLIFLYVFLFFLKLEYLIKTLISVSVLGSDAVKAAGEGAAKGLIRLFSLQENGRGLLLIISNLMLMRQC